MRFGKCCIMAGRVCIMAGRGCFGSQHAFEVARGTGVGREIIKRFLGPNWSMRKIEEALAASTPIPSMSQGRWSLNRQGYMKPYFKYSELH